MRGFIRMTATCYKYWGPILGSYYMARYLYRHAVYNLRKVV